MVEGSRIAGGYEGHVKLATGEVVGTGYGPTFTLACQMACKDAMKSGNPSHRTAGRGNAHANGWRCGEPACEDCGPAMKETGR